MAQLKNTTVTGSLRATDTISSITNQFQILNIPTTSNGTTYGPGDNGQVLKSNGTSVYWASDNDNDNDTKVTQAAAITTAGAYPIILAKSTATTATTDTVNKTSTLTYNPSTKALVTGGTVNGYTLAAASAKGVTDNTSNADVTNSDTNLITGRTLYYQLAKKGYTTNTGTVTSITLTAGSGISINSSDAITTSGTRTITNTGVRAVTTGSTNGTISVNTNGTSNEVAVAGLGSNAYTSTAYAPLASPALTGTPTAPTATAGTSTTQIATTAFVANALAASSSGVTSANSTSKLFLLGATSQSSSGVTSYSNTYVFATNGILSAASLGINNNSTVNEVRLVWNSTEKCLDFVF